MTRERGADSAVVERIRRAIREVPDFPRPGIAFKDITPALADAELFAAMIRELAAPFRGTGVSHVAGVESRGFILAAPVAHALGAGFLPVRKGGKLPSRTVGRSYALEYGSDRLELHADACAAGSRVLVVDDVLATGGTAEAACGLVEDVGAEVAACLFLLEIEALAGRGRLEGRLVHVLLRD